MKPYISMLKQNHDTRNLVYERITTPMQSGIIHKEKYGAFFVHDVTKEFTEEERRLINSADCIYSEIAWQTEAGDYWRLMKEKHGKEIPHYHDYIAGIQRTIENYAFETGKPVIIVSNKTNMDKFIRAINNTAFPDFPMDNITVLESKILGTRCYVGFLNMPKSSTPLKEYGGHDDSAMVKIHKVTDTVPFDSFHMIQVEGFVSLQDLRWWIYIHFNSVYDFSCGVGNSFGEMKSERQCSYCVNYAIGSDVNPTFTEFCRRYWGTDERSLLK